MTHQGFCSKCGKKFESTHELGPDFVCTHCYIGLPDKIGISGPDSDHYTVNGITPMEYVKAMGQNEYRGACILNIIKYVSRYPYKGSAMKDLQKAKWYVDQLIIAQEEIEASESPS